ncbi:MAG: metallophosphoesterase [Defluviitaleaceae bacterium]|nr:metallophosphoesterase [Defluviitaleaceae bacterium]
MKAKVERIALPEGKRVICVSDIHGSLDLFRRLLDKVRYGADDVLILLGDYLGRGRQQRETLEYVMEMSKNPNVYAIRGNWDWAEWVTDIFTASPSENDWLERLPHVIETRGFIFVHAGLTSSDLDEQDAWSCMKNDAFAENGLKFDKYVVTGHWPVYNYVHEAPCFNPIVDEESKIISIDGGNGVDEAGQLNAFIIDNGRFSFDYADDLPEIRVDKAQTAGKESLNITWNDRFVELVEKGDVFSVYRHMRSGKVISLPTAGSWADGEGRLCRCGTDYRLPVRAGDTVSVVERYGGRIYAKKDGTAGWILEPGY